jgi:homoserine dehydrogenase
MLGYPTWLVVSSMAMGLIGTGGVGYLLKTVLDHKQRIRKQTDEVAMSLVMQQSERITQLEASIERERALCDAKLGVQRHRVNNLSMNFDSMLMIMELAPEKAVDAVRAIKERRAQQDTAEAVEKGAVAAIAAGMGLHGE